MWQRVVKIVGSIVLWGLLGAVVFYAATLVTAHRKQQIITSMHIEIADSTEARRLVTSARIQSWIDRSNIEVKGENIDSVDIGGIERVIECNSFIEKVDVYVTHSGRLNISVKQRKPVVRLMTEGYNSYLTSDGIIFRAPKGSALYVPIITGNYRPVVPADFEGDTEEFLDEQLDIYAQRIKDLEAEIVELDKERSRYTAMRRSPQRRSGEGFFAHLARKKAWREEWKQNKHKIRSYSIGMERDVALRRSKVEQQLAAVHNEQKKFKKRYADFRNLITFVEQLSKDDYWSAEVVQFVAHNTPDSELDIELIPRSGNFSIRLGRLDDAEQKLDKLVCFFEKGLSRTGWDKYKTIDIRYNKQVVCTE